MDGSLRFTLVTSRFTNGSANVPVLAKVLSSQPQPPWSEHTETSGQFSGDRYLQNPFSRRRLVNIIVMSVPSVYVAVRIAIVVGDGAVIRISPLENRRIGLQASCAKCRKIRT